MAKTRLFLVYGAALAAAATVAAVTLQASNASIDRYNAVHMRNPVSSQMPGWNCNDQGCATQAQK